MADPVTLSMIAIGLGVGAIGMGAGTSVMSQRYNAEAARMAAKSAQEQAAIVEAQQREASKRLMATARARLGTTGVMVEGSPLQVLTESARQAEMDALNVRYTGQLNATALRSQAKLYEKQIPFTILGGVLKAGSLTAGGLSEMPSDGKTDLSWQSKYFEGGYFKK